MIASKPLIVLFRSSRYSVPLITILVGVLAYLTVAAIGTSAATDLEAFPAAETGMVRHVIQLPQLPEENLIKVELMVGKTVKTDSKNRYFFAGKLKTESIPGWGYNRYILPELGPMAGTLMAVDPDARLVERFITLSGEAPLIRYNSRLPIVVYLPTGVELQHRLWRAESQPTDTARFFQKMMLPGKLVAVISEGDWEARSIGSYSVSIYSTEHAASDDDTTFFVSAITRKRDGGIERILLAELGAGEPPSLIVVIRSAGSGGYLSADAFTVTGERIELRGSVYGLPARADPVQNLTEDLQSEQQGQ
jgi:ecotin